MAESFTKIMNMILRSNEECDFVWGVWNTDGSFKQELPNRKLEAGCLSIPKRGAVHEDWSSLHFRIYGTSYSDRMILYDDSWIVDADYEE